MKPRDRDSGMEVMLAAIADVLATSLNEITESEPSLSRGGGALQSALYFPIREIVEDVYADCGDSDPVVLALNIARDLGWLIPLAILEGGREPSSCES